MLIVTPAAGTWAEPRPQQLITGDRAISLLDTVSSTALQKAGVKVATVSKTTYNQLVASLVPEVFDGLDPVTGQLKEDVIPDRLSVAAISQLDLTGIDGKIESAFLPDYLTTGGIANLIGASSAVAFDTDGDGTPVVLGGTPAASDWTLTGTLTAGGVTAGTVHGDLITGTQATVTSLTTTKDSFTNQTVAPTTPTSGVVSLYTDTNGRLTTVESTGLIRHVVTHRTNNNGFSWSAIASPQVGDTLIDTDTGEHRIYKGATYGWRLASSFQVADLTARNALNTLYHGYRVWVSASNQEHVWGNDEQWHGTQPVFVAGGAPQPVASVNDTNFRLWNTTPIADPGYPYRIVGRLGMELAELGVKARSEVWVNLANPDGTGVRTFDIAYTQTTDPYVHYALSPWTNFDVSGAKVITINWRIGGNNANAYSGNYQYYNDYQIVPV